MPEKKSSNELRFRLSHFPSRHTSSKRVGQPDLPNHILTSGSAQNFPQ